MTHEADIAAHANRVVRMRDGKIASDERRGVAGDGAGAGGPARGAEADAPAGPIERKLS